jgi:trehalose 6-phosphate synthase
MSLFGRWGRVPENPLIVVSNREPFIHQRDGDGALRLVAPAGGLISALQPVMAIAGGTWVAWGSGSGDFELTDAGDTLPVPPELPSYRLRRLRLTAEEIAGYYLETANRALWPLCHSQLPRFVYDATNWLIYRRVNERFAAATIAEARGRPATCWIQDYHLALVPDILRRVRHLFVHQFWHIPWPPADILGVLPSARALLTGLLGNNLLGFQTARDAGNFLDGVGRFLRDAVVDPARGLVRYRGRRTVVRDFPISIDAAVFAERARDPSTETDARRLRRSVLPGEGQLFLGVDRLDYTKGIPLRFRALERLLDAHPEWVGKVTLVQIGVPTRMELPEYASFESEVTALAEAINGRFHTADWRPIHLITEQFDHETLVAYYRAADVCIVSPLMDGMNLVAKEYIASQEGRLGVLVLSRFAGAAHEMREALLIDPNDVAAMTEGLYQAASMPARERDQRMTALRRRVLRHTIQHWMDEIFAEVARERRHT